MNKSELKQLIRETIAEVSPKAGNQFEVFFTDARGESFSILTRGANKKAAIANAIDYFDTHYMRMDPTEQQIFDNVVKVEAK